MNRVSASIAALGGCATAPTAPLGTGSLVAAASADGTAARAGYNLAWGNAQRDVSPEGIAVRKTLVRDVIPIGVTIEDERRQWEAFAASVKLPEGIVLRDESVGGVPCVWVEEAAAAARGVVFYVHGGGLISGSPRTHAEFASRVARRLSRRVLLVDFRLAPEHPFPAALDDVRAAYRGLLERMDARELVLAGESSGAGLALALLVDVKGSLPLPAAAFFISGHFDMTLGGASMSSREKVDPLTTRESLGRAAEWYTCGTDRASPRVSPVFAQLGDLPPLLLQVGDDEILLDDSTRVAAAVQRAGGLVGLSIWKGMWHTWPMYAGLPEADEALAEIERFLADSL
jgi:epsilon-lactone hydrolase